MMFRKVKAVNALPDYRLSVQFAEGVTKSYDVKPLFAKWESFNSLKNDPALFSGVEVDACKYGKHWVISTEAMKREYGQPKTTLKKGKKQL